ncbi:hypothetical protein M513_12074 [Trichuris suis]|uniref:Uncharacterized protein n=1 Tax=Trichuris suis TaxID=68888 RepID=A0A085LQ40_9BILA|nr:hypothetical protein M513_12074 [Trichuris suis]
MEMTSDNMTVETVKRLTLRVRLAADKPLGNPCQPRVPALCDRITIFQCHFLVKADDRIDSVVLWDCPCRPKAGSDKPVTMRYSSGRAGLALSVTVDTFTIAELDVLVSPTLKRRRRSHAELFGEELRGGPGSWVQLLLTQVE